MTSNLILIMLSQIPVVNHVLFISEALKFSLATSIDFPVSTPPMETDIKFLTHITYSSNESSLFTLTYTNKTMPDYLKAEVQVLYH